MRAADVGKLKFSSFDDLVGHDVAVRAPVLGLFEQPTVSPEMWQFLSEHHNMVETNGVAISLGMLAAGHADYAVVSLIEGKRAIAIMGLVFETVPVQCVVGSVPVATSRNYLAQTSLIVASMLPRVALENGQVFSDPTMAACGG